jgi:hypothetical protein
MGTARKGLYPVNCLSEEEGELDGGGAEERKRDAENGPCWLSTLAQTTTPEPEKV